MLPDLVCGRSEGPQSALRVDRREQPKGDIPRLIGILRLQPALQTFAATAKSGGGRIHTSWDKPDFDTDRVKPPSAHTP
jgi:hypothetical protein